MHNSMYKLNNQVIAFVMEKTTPDRVRLPPDRLLTALSIFPRSAFDGFYHKMSLSHGYLLRIRINQVREVSIVYCQWIVIAYGIPFH